MKVKKLVAVILTLIMLLGCFSVCSSAADKYYYAVLGDSIAFGSGLVNAFDACYGKMVADTCNFDYANRSVPGATTGELIGVLGKKDVRDVVSAADIISISIGGNDFLNELSDLMYDSIVEEDYTDFDRVGEKIYTNITQVIKNVRELNGDAVILLQTLYNPQFGYLKESYQQGADRVNAAVYRCAKENAGVEVVDVAAALNGDEANFADDTMHPSARGNKKIAREVLASLNRLGFTKKTRLEEDFPGIDVVLGPAASQALDYYAFFFHVVDKAFEAIYTVI